jgi:hypothetical protein
VGFGLDLLELYGGFLHLFSSWVLACTFLFLWCVLLALDSGNGDLIKFDFLQIKYKNENSYFIKDATNKIS